MPKTSSNLSFSRPKCAQNGIFHAMKCLHMTFGPNLWILGNLGADFQSYGSSNSLKPAPRNLCPQTCSKLKNCKLKCAWNGVFHLFMPSNLVFDQKFIFLLDLGAKIHFDWNRNIWKLAPRLLGHFPCSKVKFCRPKVPWIAFFLVLKPSNLSFAQNLSFFFMLGAKIHFDWIGNICKPAPSILGA